MMAIGNKSLNLLVLLATTLAASLNVSAAWARHRTEYRFCDSETGDAVRPDIQALNRLKNRQTAPTAQNIDGSVSLTSMLRPGDDRNRWDDHKAARLIGYIADVKIGGVETVKS